MIPVLWISFNDTPARCRWDADIVDVVCPLTFFTHYGEEGRVKAPETDGAVVVFSCGENEKYVDQLNEFLSKFQWIVLLLISDEASRFPWEALQHPNMKLWIQSPRTGRHVDLRTLPVGSPHTSVFLSIPDDRPQPLAWVFAGQVSHRVREEASGAMQRVMGGESYPTSGFTLGMSRDEYLVKLSTAKVAPCPSGPMSADTFRVWEALEAGAIPIVDDGPLHDPLGRADAHYPSGFWQFMDPPFPVVSQWNQAPALVEELLADWPASANRVQSWYQGYKRRLRLQMLDDVGTVAGNYAGPPGSNITVLVPTSPTPNNPSHSHLDAVYTAIRDQLPNSEILLLIDGVRPEQEHRRAAYNEYIRRILWLTAHHWTNVTPILFDRMEHQSGKVREALKHVRTDFILFNEHDTPMQGDIDWDLCIRELADDHLDLIRFYHEAAIHPEHAHLMLGNVHPNLVATEQFSGRPHIARTDYYRRIMDEHFSDASRTFIEWTMHGKCQVEEWGCNRMALYAPSEGTMVRSGHLDARGGDPTFEDVTT